MFSCVSGLGMNESTQSVRLEDFYLYTLSLKLFVHIRLSFNLQVPTV